MSAGALPFLESMLEDIESLGIGSDEPVDGGDAVDLLNDLRDALRDFLGIES